MSNGATKIKFLEESGEEPRNKRGREISWRSIEAEYLKSPENSQEPVVPPTQEPVVPPTQEPVVPPTQEPVVPPTIKYSAEQIKKLDEQNHARRSQKDPDWPKNKTRYASKFGKSKSSVRLDPVKDVEKQRKNKTSEKKKLHKRNNCRFKRFNK